MSVKDVYNEYPKRAREGYQQVLRKFGTIYGQPVIDRDKFGEVYLYKIEFTNSPCMGRHEKLDEHYPKALVQYRWSNCCSSDCLFVYFLEFYGCITDIIVNELHSNTNSSV
jgi:hypothetical protein